MISLKISPYASRKPGPGRGRRTPVALALTALVGAASLLVGGCGGEEEPVAQAPPPPPPPKPTTPPPPKITPIADLMERHRIDERVVLPEEKAPDNDPDRIAVLQFFDAFVRGDAATLGEMMSFADKIELDELVESGDWARTVENIEQVDVQTGPSDFGDCALAVFTVDLEFQPQLWYYQGDESGHTFEAGPTPPNIMSRLSGTNWIQRWHEILAEELALADQPDVELERPQVNLDEEGESGASAGSGPSANPGSPSPGRNPFGRRPPPRTPRRPPGPR